MSKVSVMKKNQQGFTLVEIIVVMAVFIVVMMISADAFKTIITQTAKLFRSEESNIEGVIGLEMMRHDLQQGGYGLFTQVSPVAYEEADNAPANATNEVANTDPPRAFVARNNLPAAFGILLDTDYLSIKGTSVARSRASQRWTSLRYVAGTGGVPNTWPSAAENFANDERVVLMQRRVNQTENTLTLVPNGSAFSFAYSPTAFAAYSSNTDTYIMYGLDNAGTPKRPFNRTDYFVARPATASQVPEMCAPNAGILYKTTLNQADGNLMSLPILDCVADMQVVFGWDLYDGTATGTDGLIDTYSNADGSVASGSASQTEVQDAMDNAAAIRTSLKMVKIYILAQNGRRDPGYTSPATIRVGGPTEVSVTRIVDIAAAGWLNYRWKLYQIVVRPKNLTSNQ